MLKHLRGTANNMYEHKGNFRKEMENRRKYENEMLPLKAVSQSVQSLSHVRLFATPWIAAHQASLSITNAWSSLKLTSI